MASRQIEDLHTLLLKKLISDTGLECNRTPVDTTESSSFEEEWEEEEIYEEEEVIPEVELEAESEESAIIEEEPPNTEGLFPTPSLRKLLPEKVRNIEAQNRVHVLPESFRTDINPEAIPVIKHTPEQKYIDDLAKIVGCHEYKHNLAEYWFLDTLANLIRRAQEAYMDRPTQAILILWWCEWMKEIQHFDAADRPRMMRRFQDNMLSAARFVAENQHLPTPDEAGVYYKAPNNKDKAIKETSFDFEEVSYECAIQDLVKIMHYIYDVFSTDFQFDLIRSVFTFTPGYTLIDAPNQMQMPKKNYQVAKPKNLGLKKEKSSQKIQKGTKERVRSGSKDMRNKSVNEDYLYLMAIMAREQRDLAAQEEIDREQWLLKTSILPLGLAVTDEFLNKYWPPPSPSPVDSKPESPPKEPPKKGKKK